MSFDFNSKWNFWGLTDLTFSEYWTHSHYLFWASEIKGDASKTSGRQGRRKGWTLVHFLPFWVMVCASGIVLMKINPLGQSDLLQMVAGWEDMSRVIASTILGRYKQGCSGLSQAHDNANSWTVKWQFWLTVQIGQEHLPSSMLLHPLHLWSASSCQLVTPWLWVRQLSFLHPVPQLRRLSALLPRRVFFPGV